MTDASPNAYRLAIVGGPQGGAHVMLDTARRTTLGGDDADDIVLLDPRVGAAALVFSGDGDALQVEVRGDDAVVDGRALPAGGRYPCRPGASYAIGATRFLIERADAASTGTSRDDVAGTGAPAGWSADASVAPFVVPFGAPSGDRDGDADEARQAAALARTATRSPLLRTLLGVCTLTLVAVGTSWALHRSADTDALDLAAAAVPREIPLAQRLDEAGFVDVSVAEAANGRPLVQGYVETRARRLALARLLGTAAPGAALEVHVQSEIVDGVRDVYRTNGVEAEIESVGPGTVGVATAVPDTVDLGALVAAARTDVKGLLMIESSNAPPAAPTPESATAPAPAEDPGKRVVAIVGGDPSYVLTEDDSRYFVGSALPSGHTIAAIDGDSVVLDRQGTTTTLEF